MQLSWIRVCAYHHCEYLTIVEQCFHPEESLDVGRDESDTAVHGLQHRNTILTIYLVFYFCPNPLKLKNPLGLFPAFPLAEDPEGGGKNESP